MAAPKFGDISTHTLGALFVNYDIVLESFYNDKVKDDKKRKQALEDDLWRYSQLPSDLIRRQSNSGLKKAELERLVRWKITHQTNRPFLLPQIRKNDDKVVADCTLQARNILLGTRTSKQGDRPKPSRGDVQKALDKVCELTGVGPATGTLILSIYSPEHVPFFEDELHAWLFPELKAKLKYNTKEYFQMYDKIQEFLTADEQLEEPMFKASDLEKTAFLCQHWEYLDVEKQTLTLHILHEVATVQVAETQKDKQSEELLDEPSPPRKTRGIGKRKSTVKDEESGTGRAIKKTKR